MWKKKEILIAGLLFFFVTTILLWQMVFKGMYLFPGDFLLAWFEPYKSENISKNSGLLIPHKPVNDDAFRHIYPFRALSAEMLTQYQLPLWNPYGGAGMPLLATLNSGILDPLHVLHFVFPYPVVWSITLFLQYASIGFFTYLYCRSIRFGRVASTFSAISYMVSGFVVARLGFATYGYILAALPFLLYIIEAYLKNFRTKLVFFIPIILFFLFTSAQPPVAFYVLSFAAIYFLLRVFVQPFSLRKKLLFFLIPGVFVLLGVASAAVQILPTAELLTYANLNTESSSYISKFLVPVQHLISIGIPNYFGNQATYNFWGQTDYVQTVASIGLIPCFFAYLFIFFTKETKEQPRIKSIFAFTILVTILLAVDSPLSQFILTLPILFISTDPPSRIFLLTTFSIAILAGGGIDYFYKQNISLREKIRMAWPFVTVVGIICLVTAYLYFSSAVCAEGKIVTCYKVAFRNTLLEIGVFSIGLILFFLRPSFFKDHRRTILSSSIVLIVFAIGFYNAQKFFPFTVKERVLPVSSFIQTLQEKTTDARVFGYGDATIATNLATHFRFYDPQYYHPLYVKRYGEFTAYGNYGTVGTNVHRSDAEVLNKSEFTTEEEIRHKRLLALLNVKYLIFNSVQTPPPEDKTAIIWSDKLRYIEENDSVLPRAFTVSQVFIENDSEKILQTLFRNDFDPLKQVIVEEQLPFTPKETEVNGNVSITELKENTVSMQTQTASDSVLVLLDNYYPGWNAYVDGVKTPVYRANYTFRAIVLPKGDHEVTFIYEPKSVRWGIIISLGTGILLLLLFFIYPRIVRNIPRGELHKQH